MRSSFIDTLSPETLLLVCCARTRMCREVAQEVRALAASNLNWDALLYGADQNSMVPLLDRHLRAVAADVAPTPQMIRVNEANRANTLRCLNLTAALMEILRLFSAEGIAALPYKGPVLAVQAYGDVSLRQFDDVDIILRHRDVAKAHGVMLGLGYAAKFDVNASFVPGEYKYYSETRAAIVELHTELTLRHFPIVPNLDDFYSRSIDVNLGGHAVRTFSPEDALIAICVHGSKDFWGRLSWVADVAELIGSNPSLDWREISRRAKSLRVQRMLQVGLILAARILGTTLPGEIAGEVRGKCTAEAIAVESERDLLLPDPPSLGARERFDLRRRLVPGFFAGWCYALRLTMAPAEEDWMMVRLPRPLAPFYILLRPFRLLRKYGRSHEAV
jgi:putative nucleotidyltransferase-like protein